MTDKYPTINTDTRIGRKVLRADATPTDACRVVPMVGKGEDLLTELRARVEELTDE